MKNTKQQRTFLLLGFVTVALLLVAQVLSQQTLRASTDELASEKGNVQAMKMRVTARTQLVSKYKQLEATMTSSGRENYIYPENALALYEVVDGAFALNSVEHTNRSSSQNTVPGGILELQISFKGPYYSVLKSLGAIRESQYLMKISDLTIETETNTNVKGTVKILSIAKS